jgi:hypothetical protein
VANVFGRARQGVGQVAQRVGQSLGQSALRVLHGAMGNALADWLEHSDMSPVDIDRAFTDGKASELIRGAFQQVREQDIDEFRGRFGALAGHFGPDDYARILDAAATRQAVTMHVDVIGRLHWQEYVAIMDDLRFRFLNGLPLVDP